MEMPKVQDEVMREYEKNLIVPSQPSRKLFILCPVGLVGAGKTTVVKPLAEKLSLVRLSGDEIRKVLKDHDLAYDAVVPIGMALSKKYLSQGYSLALDSDAISPRSKDVIETAEHEFGAIPLWIHVNPPESFILNKLRTHEHTWLFRDARHAIENYMKCKPLHEHLEGIPFLYTFDTSRENLDVQISEAAEIIKEAVKISK